MISREKIHSAGPWITEKEIAYATEATRSGWYSDYRLWTERFEEGFAGYLGVKYALATSSGTGALHLALAVNDIKAGDEVIVPDISWVATANVVRYLGAEPVFVDVRLGDWNIDPAKIEAAITPKTKAIFPVHLYGHAADMEAICAIAEKHDLLVIEDACPAVGSNIGGKLMGTYGVTSGFSFQGAKMLATGQGGMFVTDDEKLYQRAVSLIEHGRDPSKGMFYSAEVGYQYKIPSVAAAIGVAQLERVEELIERKRQCFSWYIKALDGIAGINFQEPMEGSFSNYSYPSIRIDPEISTPAIIAEAFKAQNIDSRPAFPRMSSFPAFQDADTPVARNIEETGINLPTAAYLEETDVREICAVLADVLQRGKR
jgi:perosamine synthetase